MGVFGGASPMVIVGTIVTAVSCLIHIIGFSTTYWYKVGNTHYGLWQVCAAGHCGKLVSSILSDSYKGAQALECLALVAFIGALVCIALKLFVVKDKKELYIVIAVVNFIAGGFALIGVIIYGTMDGFDSSKFHFSFAFCIISSLGAVVAGVLFILGRNS